MAGGNAQVDGGRDLVNLRIMLEIEYGTRVRM